MIYDRSKFNNARFNFPSNVCLRGIAQYQTVGQPGKLRSIFITPDKCYLLLGHYHLFPEVLLKEALTLLVAEQHLIHGHVPIPWLHV